MAAIVKAINQKLDMALSRFQEIYDLKENLKDLHIENNDLNYGLSKAHKEISELKEITKAKAGSIEGLRKGVN